MKNWDYIFKLIIVGDSGVGKSNLMLHYADSYFDFSHHPTIFVDFKSRAVQVDNSTIHLYIWDTAGQDRFQTLTTSDYPSTTAYYRGSQGIFLVYDITNLKSFQNITKWMNEVRKYAKDDVQVFLIGNKSDLEYRRAVSYSSGKELADMIGALFMETSARESKNVEEAFIQMSKNIFKCVNIPPYLCKKTTTKALQQVFNLKFYLDFQSYICLTKDQP